MDLSALISQTRAIKEAFASIKSALTGKGVSVSDDYRLSDVANSIKDIDDYAAGYNAIDISDNLDITHWVDNLIGDSTKATINPVYLIDTTTLESLEGLFQDATELTSLTLPTGFGGGALYLKNCFSGCSALTTLNLPEGFGYKTLDLENCFSGCSVLTTLNLPGGFGYAAENTTSCFDGCVALSNISGNPQFKVSVDFSMCPLTTDSIKAIISGLQSGLDYTPVLTLGEDNLSRTSASYRDLLTSKGWEVS